MANHWRESGKSSPMRLLGIGSFELANTTRAKFSSVNRQPSGTEICAALPKFAVAGPSTHWGVLGVPAADGGEPSSCCAWPVWLRRQKQKAAVRGVDKTFRRLARDLNWMEHIIGWN